MSPAGWRVVQAQDRRAGPAAHTVADARPGSEPVDHGRSTVRRGADLDQSQVWLASQDRASARVDGCTRRPRSSTGSGRGPRRPARSARSDPQPAARDRGAVSPAGPATAPWACSAASLAASPAGPPARPPPGWLAARSLGGRPLRQSAANRSSTCASAVAAGAAQVTGLDQDRWLRAASSSSASVSESTSYGRAAHRGVRSTAVEQGLVQLGLGHLAAAGRQIGSLTPRTGWSSTQRSSGSGASPG
jgi:hypothetical protein